MKLSGSFWMYTLRYVGSFLLFVFLGSCGSSDVQSESWLQENGKVKVLCTIAMIEDLIKEVGGDHVDTWTLVKGELDPHSYQLVKGDDERLSYAALIFFNGLGLEHGPSLKEYLAKSQKAVGLGDEIRSQNPGLILTYDGTVDPHIWMDVSLWAKAVPYIVKHLSDYDPEHAKSYRENGDLLLKKMGEAHRQYQEQLARVPEKKRYLITSHDAFNYFTRAYLATEDERHSGEWQKRFAAPEGLAPESQLSANDIRLILEHMKKYKVHTLFPESNVSQASIRKLLDAGNEEKMRLNIASEPLYGDAMGAPGSSGDTHLKMIQHNVETIANYLSRDGGSDGP